MAKYTQLLSEWLDGGGELPAVFDTIEGFKELFVANFIDREIGFETPNLFKIKLDLRANLVIPAYQSRIQAIKQAAAQILQPDKAHTRSGVVEHRKEGEILRTYGRRDTQHDIKQNGIRETTTTPQTKTSTNTKAGEIIKTDGEINNSDRVTTVKTYDLPILGDTITGTTSEVSPTNVQVTNDGIGENIESYRDYEDKTIITTLEEKQSEKFTNYGTTDKVISEEYEDGERFINYVEADNYNNLSDKETGLSSAEALEIKREYENQIINIKEQLLNEFNNCFMVIY